ncbi:hypothetical protein LZ30DRAFT_684763 [Colletotrichum cereale]|nr:hypothetical protein LZ30DRAFT_684763 [Colletotrichum cereale]
MRESYKDADQVPVLDGYLLSAEGPMSDNELLLRIYCAPWSRRLWILQEGYLPRKLVFRLADRYLPSRYFLEKSAFYCNKAVQGGSPRRDYEIAIEPLPTQSLSYILGLREREEEPMALNDAKAALKYRATSVAEDEPLCLSNLLGVDPAAVNKGHGALVFARGAKLRSPGYRWALISLMDGHPLEFYGRMDTR